MSDVVILLARCRELGAVFTTTPDGKLKVKAPAPLPEELRQQLKRCKNEVLGLLEEGVRPYLTPAGKLIIPFDSDPRYHWWKLGSQSIRATLVELEAPPAVLARYIEVERMTVQ